MTLRLLEDLEEAAGCKAIHWGTHTHATRGRGLLSLTKLMVRVILWEKLRKASKPYRDLKSIYYKTSITYRVLTLSHTEGNG